MNRVAVRLTSMIGAVCGLTATQVFAADNDPFVCRFDATTGSPDTSFGTAAIGQGCLRWDDGPTGLNDEYNDVEVDSAGRIVACGRYTRTDGPRGFMIVRHLSNGLWDHNFGPGGWGAVQHSWPATSVACATDSTGRIVAALSFGAFGSPGGIMVRRFNAFDGSWDSGFGPFGYEWIDTATAPSVADIKIDHDGRILIAGNGRNVFRLSANGFRDTNYGTQGVATAPSGPIHGMGVDALNRVVVALESTPGGQQMSAARLDAQGIVETVFGANAATIDFPGFGTSRPGGVRIDGSGAIYLGGWAATFGTPGTHFAVARLQSNGQVLSRTTTGFDNMQWAHATEIAGNNTGTFYLAGTMSLTGSFHRFVGLARYTPSGIDTSFSGDGKATHDFGGTPNATVTALAVDGFGKPVVVGYTGD